MSKAGKALILHHMLTKASPKKGPENTLVVFRHGSTNLNNESDERFRAWADVPLSEDGKKEVLESAKKLHDKGIAGIITSDLKRCVETAEIIAKELDIPILEESKGLRPWHLGVLTGQPVRPNLPALEAYIKNPDVQVPDGESFNDFKKRMVGDVLRVQKKYPRDKILIVTHHRGERLVKAWMDAGKPTDHSKLSHDPFMHKGVKPGSFIEYEVDPTLLNEKK